MIKFFNAQWDQVPICVVDTETTGIKPGVDRACQVGVARFERGVCVGEFVSLVNPNRLIPEAATAIHGITNDMIDSAPSIADVFAEPPLRELLLDGQPTAFNAMFDRDMVPPFAEDHSWPWLDVLSLVRVVDRYARGSGRHRLSVAAERHGIVLSNAHDALADAKAAGELLFKLGPGHYGKSTLGQVLRDQRIAEANDWHRFCDWVVKQPPRRVAS
jgi:DNA polymerase III subunit epsilon